MSFKARVLSQSTAGIVYLCGAAECVLQVALLSGMCVQVTLQCVQLGTMFLDKHLSFPFPAERLTELHTHTVEAISCDLHTDHTHTDTTHIVFCLYLCEHLY